MSSGKETNEAETAGPIALSAYEKLAEGFSKKAPTKAENSYIERPGIIRAIGDKLKGKKIFEAGCGPGILAEYLVHEGAVVVGFDVSPKMIELARKRVPEHATFFVHDMAGPLPLDHSGEFDLVVASLSIDYVKDWSIPLKEFYRLLKPSGRFIFTIQHPTASYNWYNPPTAFGVHYVESVWKEFTEEPVVVPDYYRSISEVINPLVCAGFRIVNLEDLRPIEALQKVDPYRYGKYSKLPSFLCVTVEKS